MKKLIRILIFANVFLLVSALEQNLQAAEFTSYSLKINNLNLYFEDAHEAAQFQSLYHEGRREFYSSKFSLQPGVGSSGVNDGTLGDRTRFDFITKDGYQRIAINSVGAREYFLFPRRTQQRFVISPDEKTVSIYMANGGVLTFSTSTGKLSNVTGFANWKMDEPKLLPDSPQKHNQHTGDSLTLIPKRGDLMIDFGFRMSDIPSHKRNQPVTLKGDGKECVMHTPDLMNFIKGNGGVLVDTVPKFKNEVDLMALVNANKNIKCVLPKKGSPSLVDAEPQIIR